MGQADRSQAFPVAIVELAGIAQRQGLHEARAAIRDHLRDPRGHALAPGGEAGRRRQPRCRVRRTYRAASGQVQRQGLPFGVVAAGIGKSARGPHAQAQTPALAPLHLHSRTGRLRAVIVVPRHLQASPPQRRRRGRLGRNRQQEARAPGLVVRQVHDAPGDLDFPSFQCRRHVPFQRPPRVQAGPGAPAQEQCGRAQPGCPAACHPPTPHAGHERGHGGRPRHRPRRPQRRGSSGQQCSRHADARLCEGAATLVQRTHRQETRENRQAWHRCSLHHRLHSRARNALAGMWGNAGCRYRQTPKGSASSCPEVVVPPLRAYGYWRGAAMPSAPGIMGEGCGPDGFPSSERESGDTIQRP